VFTLGKVFVDLARRVRVCKHIGGLKGGNGGKGGISTLDTQPTRRRSTSVSLGVAAVLAATLTGCSASAGEEEYDYAAVCADQQTQQRVADDEDCDDRGSYGWYYIPVGTVAPAIGQRVSGGSFDPPPSAQAVCLGGVPDDGGTIERGGFGGCSDTVGG
jgi:hypothetical protein